MNATSLRSTKIDLRHQLAIVRMCLDEVAREAPGSHRHGAMVDQLRDEMERLARLTTGIA